MKINHFVHQSLFFIILLCGGLKAAAELLPQIETKQFESTPIKKSQSGRVYLFKIDSKTLPKTGSIILIQDQNKPAMAFRVLRNDESKSEYIGKRIRRYDQTRELNLNEKYFSIEKVGDLLSAPDAEPVTPPPPSPESTHESTQPMLAPVTAKSEIAEEIKTKKEEPTEEQTEEPLPSPPTSSPSPAAAVTPDPVEKTEEVKKPTAPDKTDQAMDVEAYDQDLDEETSPRILKNQDPSLDEEGSNEPDEDSPRSKFEVEETHQHDPYDYLIEVSVGYLKNMSNFALANSYINGIRFNFAKTLDRNIWVDSKKIQDDLSLDLGFEYYQRVNDDQHNDLYTIMPVYSELRYGVHFSDSFEVHGYLGLQYNFITSTQNVDPNGVDQVPYNALHGPQANIGFGFLYNIGPQWYLRADLGLDRMTVGLAIKW